MDLNKPGSGLKLQKQIRQHTGMTNKHSTRQKQLETFKTKPKPKKSK